MFKNNDQGYSPGNTGVSMTLEYAYTDWCMARLAELLGKMEDSEAFDVRARSYATVFDSDFGWFRLVMIKAILCHYLKLDVWRSGMVVWNVIFISKAGLFLMMWQD